VYEINDVITFNGNVYTDIALKIMDVESPDDWTEIEILKTLKGFYFY
jgi:hypothetical protein